MKVFTFFLFIFLALNLNAQLARVDSFKKIIATAKDDKAKINALNAYATYLQNSDLTQAPAVAKEAQMLAEKIDWQEGIAECYMVSGDIYLDQSKLEMALNNFKEALKISKALEDKKLLCKSYNRLGVFYDKIADYPKALEYQMKTMHLSEKVKDYKIIVNSLNSIGGIYYNIENYNKALEYWKKTMALARQKKDKISLARAMNNIGLAYQNLKEIDTAKKYYLSCIELTKGSGYNILESIVYQNLSDIYREAGNFDKATELSNHSLVIDIRMGNEERQSDDYEGLASISFDKKDYPKASEYADKSLALARSSKAIVKMRTILELQYKIHEKLNNPAKALEFYKAFIRVEDSIKKTDHLNAIAQTELKFTIAQKDALAEAEVQKQRIKTYASILGIILLIITAFTLNNRFLIKKKALEQLQRSQQMLVQQEKLASLGQLTAGIAHEIQNPLNFVNNFSELNKELIQEIKDAKTDEEIGEILAILEGNLTKISQHGKRAESIVKGMLLHSREGTSEKQPTDINKLCDEYLDLAFYSISAANPDFNCDIQKQFDALLPKPKLVTQ
ncbi:MAG: tetratricopeptide repeat protein, partial [Bacteroidetes bacterium]|nr:tetratricopeptide repeat protein [Bacteroidota bacterium]